MRMSQCLSQIQIPLNEEIGMPVQLTPDVIVQLTLLAKKRFNTLLTSGHGIGKTTVVGKIASELGITPVKYFSCGTIDPWVDFVGIPVPNVTHIKFLRPKDVMDARWLILDEINRGEKKIQNSMQEIIQYKTINGEKLKN